MGELVFIGVVSLWLGGVIYAATKCLTRKEPPKLSMDRRTLADVQLKRK